MFTNENESTLEGRKSSEYNVKILITNVLGLKLVKV